MYGRGCEEELTLGVGFTAISASNKKGKGFVKAVSALRPRLVWRNGNADADLCSVDPESLLDGLPQSVIRIPLSL